MRLVSRRGLGILVPEGLERAGLLCAHSTAPLDVRRIEARARLVEAAGLDPARVASPVQVHGERVARVDAPPALPPEADGLVTDVPGLALLVKAADCSLVVVADPARRAVGVAHAGWRGAAAGVVGNLVGALVAQYGCRPSDLLAAVGPTIGVARYAVGPEVLEAFRAPWTRAYTTMIDGRLHLDLAGANRRALAECGIPPERIEVAPLCTYERADLLFSYRRQGPRAGNHGLAAGWPARSAGRPTQA